MSKKEEATKGKDKTSVDKNSQAPPIVHPAAVAAKNNTGVSKVPLKEKCEIDFPFDQETKNKKADQLVNALDQLGALEDEKKDVTSKLAEKIKAKEAEVELIKNQLKAKKETKNIVCEIVRDFDRGVREYWFDGKKLKEEKLRATDHQHDLLAAEKHVKKENEKPFALKLKPKDWILTKKGEVIELVEDDMLTLNYNNIERLASQKEIDVVMAERNKKKK